MTRSKAIRDRVLALLLAGQGFGVVVPFADALLESPPGAVHVEERSSDACPRAHVHADCVLCQHIAQRYAAASSGVAPAVAFVDGPVTVAVADAPVLRFVPARRSRSPPVV